MAPLGYKRIGITKTHVFLTFIFTCIHCIPLSSYKKPKPQTRREPSSPSTRFALEPKIPMETNRSSKRQARILSPPPPSVPARDDDDVEEEQIEKFYALIGDIKAMRDMWRATGHAQKRPRLEGLNLRSSSPWKPTFEWEDFQETGKQDEKEEGGEEQKSKGKRGGDDREKISLNLNLAL